MTHCEEIGAFAAGISLDDVPERVIERARLQTTAVLAAARAGEAAAAPFRAVAPDDPLGEIYATAAASIAHDWDDYLFMGHTGHSAVSAARAFAPDDADRALLAQIAANEVAGRLGVALFLGPHNGQFWSSIHCGSGAIAAGVALGLDAERLAHALAIALYQPPFGLWPGFMGPPTKLLTAAEPAVQGARAALLAAEGVTGPLGVIEDRRGLLATFAFARRPAMLGALGKVWLTDTLAFKPYPGCAYLQAAVEATLATGLPATEIAEVEIASGYLTCAMEGLGADAGLTPVGINFSAARSVAIAATAGRFTHEELDPAWLEANSGTIEELAARVRVRHDWDLTFETIRGTVDAGASVRDVPLRAWPGVLRRAADAGVAEAGLSLEDLRELATDRRLRGELLRILRGARGGGLGAVDTARLRMAFPAHVRIRTRDGREVERVGEERGSASRPLAEQRTVVEERCAAVGLEPAVAAAGT